MFDPHPGVDQQRAPASGRRTRVGVAAVRAGWGRHHPPSGGAPRPTPGTSPGGAGAVAVHLPRDPRHRHRQVDVGAATVGGRADRRTGSCSRRRCRGDRRRLATPAYQPRGRARAGRARVRRSVTPPAARPACGVRAPHGGAAGGTRAGRFAEPYGDGALGCGRGELGTQRRGSPHHCRHGVPAAARGARRAARGGCGAAEGAPTALGGGDGPRHRRRGTGARGDRSRPAVPALRAAAARVAGAPHRRRRPGALSGRVLAAVATARGG